MIAALAFVPLDRVIEHFEQLQEHVSDAVTRVLDYFEDNYVGRPLRHGRRPPIFVFAHSLWNMYARTDAQLPRTNNSVEGWHRSFQAGLGSYHPNFWRFLSYLISEDAVHELRRSQMLVGQQAPPPRKRYADCNARLLTVVRDYSQRDGLDYLRGVAYNISF